jgi:hypothetical protein
MSPSVQATYDAVVRAMTKAVLHDNFGWRMLLGGTSPDYKAMYGNSSDKSKKRREDWLVVWIADELRAVGFNAKPNYPDGKGGRIDIAIIDAMDSIHGAIEAKFYFTYDYKPYCCNTWTDFIKRCPRSSQQAILFGGNHLSMPFQGKAELYARDKIAPILKDGSLDFGPLEDYLRRQFEDICEFYPPRDQARETWVVGL